MNAWTTSELDKIARAEELEVATRRRPLRPIGEGPHRRVVPWSFGPPRRPCQGRRRPAGRDVRRSERCTERRDRSRVPRQIRPLRRKHREQRPDPAGAGSDAATRTARRRTRDIGRSTAREEALADALLL